MAMSEEDDDELARFDPFVRRVIDTWTEKGSEMSYRLWGLPMLWQPQ